MSKAQAKVDFSIYDPFNGNLALGFTLSSFCEHKHAYFDFIGHLKHFDIDERC